MSLVKDVNWLIKIHPSDILNLYGVEDEIKRKIDYIPSHIKIIKRNVKISPYGLYNLIDAGITTMGTVGVELPCFGKSIITVGRSHFSHKGFSVDIKSKDEYFYVLNNIKSIKRLDDGQIELAKKYAYLYFIQKSVLWRSVNLKNLELLLPGNDPYLDKICEGAVTGEDIILDE